MNCYNSKQIPYSFQHTQVSPCQQYAIQPLQQQIQQHAGAPGNLQQFQPCNQTIIPATQTTTPASQTVIPVSPGATQIPATQAATQMNMPIATPSTSDFNFSSIMDIAYTQGYLKTQIGQRVKIEFLIGTNMLVDREGILLSVGASYLTIREAETDDVLLCDLYSIKFVRFYY